MIVPSLTLSGVASTAAAEGSFALGIGDTLLAKRMYTEAGQALEKKVSGARKALDRNLFLFLAASQFFYGGDYHYALKLARRVEQKLLPNNVRPLFDHFFQDVKERTKETYRTEVDRKLTLYTSTGHPEKALELLKSHPYVLNRTELAFTRAYLCEELKRYESAAIFYASAMKFQPDDPKLAFMSAALPQWLPTVGRLDEALEYIRHQLVEIGHAVTYMTASVIGYRRAMLETELDVQNAIFKEYVSSFDQAWKLFQRLPETFQRDVDLRSYMVLCFEITGFALWKLKEEAKLAILCETALRFEPNSWRLWTMRGILRFPEAGGITDLEQAVKLGAKNYSTYYYLAGDAMKRMKYSIAKSWITQALTHNPSRPVAGQLYGWLAICFFEENASIEQIKGTFATARELAPDLKEIEENQQKFQDLLANLDELPNFHTPGSRIWQIVEGIDHFYSFSDIQERQDRSKFLRDNAFTSKLALSA